MFVSAYVYIHTYTQIIKYLQFLNKKDLVLACVLSMCVQCLLYASAGTFCRAWGIAPLIIGASLLRHIYTPSISVTSARDNSSLFSMFPILKRKKKSLKKLALIICNWGVRFMTKFQYTLSLAGRTWWGKRKITCAHLHTCTDIQTHMHTLVRTHNSSFSPYLSHNYKLSI